MAWLRRAAGLLSGRQTAAACDSAHASLLENNQGTWKRAAAHAAASSDVSGDHQQTDLLAAPASSASTQRRTSPRPPRRLNLKAQLWEDQVLTSAERVLSRASTWSGGDRGWADATQRALEEQSPVEAARDGGGGEVLPNIPLELLERHAQRMEAFARRQKGTKSREVDALREQAQVCPSLGRCPSARAWLTWSECATALPMRTFITSMLSS
jgi:hypothetical protein